MVHVVISRPRREKVSNSDTEALDSHFSYDRLKALVWSGARSMRSPVAVSLSLNAREHEAIVIVARELP